MSDLRRDPISGRWVIIAPNRSDRPHEFEHVPQRRGDAAECPFCEGNEAATPEEIFAIRPTGSPPGGPGWRVRVVPNKYPALTAAGDLTRRTEGLYAAMDGFGAHEVIIESPRHVQSFSELTDAEACDTLAAYRQRLLALKEDGRLVYGMVFKNVGAAAGASLEHTHSQLIALPIVPINVWDEMNGSLEYYQHRNCCVFCDLVDQERAAGVRMVEESAHFSVFCPFASRFPGEMWIVPKRHASHYEQIEDAEIADLAGALRRSIGRLDRALDRPAYNFIVHTAPFDISDAMYYHWHVEVIPSLTRTAGFEWGTGFYINPAPPEEAARILRQSRAGLSE